MVTKHEKKLQLCLLNEKKMSKLIKKTHTKKKGLAFINGKNVKKNILFLSIFF